MRAPEMSYSPAYHQGRDSIGTARSVRTSPHEPPHSSPPHSEWTGFDVSPRPSGPRGAHAYSAETSRRQSRVDDETTVTRVVASPGAAYKEERSRGSWADQPSLMSGDHSSSSRTHKRSVPETAPSDDSHDALLMLFRLSVPVPLWSLAACLYTCGALFFAILVSPLRLCSSVSPYFRNTSFQSQLCDLLSPALNTHERLVRMRPPISTRSPSTQWIHADLDADEPSTVSGSTRFYVVGASITVLILSPLLSIAILLFAWTAAFFWVFAMVMGNPDGTERKDDGRIAVLGVVKWWHTWLGKARKES